MQRFSIVLLASTLSVIMFSTAVLAQDTTQSSTSNDSAVPNAAQTLPAPKSIVDDSQSAVPVDRIEAECRDWAVQDGVPENELMDYVKECVEDRAVQE